MIGRLEISSVADRHLSARIEYRTMPRRAVTKTFESGSRIQYTLFEDLSWWQQRFDPCGCVSAFHRERMFANGSAADEYLRVLQERGFEHVFGAIRIPESSCFIHSANLTWTTQD